MMSFFYYVTIDMMSILFFASSVEGVEGEYQQSRVFMPSMKHLEPSSLGPLEPSYSCFKNQNKIGFNRYIL